MKEKNNNFNPVQEAEIMISNNHNKIVIINGIKFFKIKK